MSATFPRAALPYPTRAAGLLDRPPRAVSIASISAAQCSVAAWDQFRQSRLERGSGRGIPPVSDCPTVHLTASPEARYDSRTAAPPLLHRPLLRPGLASAPLRGRAAAGGDGTGGDRHGRLPVVPRSTPPVARRPLRARLSC